MLSDRAFEWLRNLTKDSKRTGALATPQAPRMLKAVSQT